MRLLPAFLAAAAASSLEPKTILQLPGSSQSSNEITPLVPRDLDNYSLSQIVLIATLDGSLEARDRSTGALMWSTGSDPLVQVEQIAGDQNGVDSVWITEFTDSGRLLYFNPATGLEQIPASIKDLVERTPFAIPGNIVYTGSKNTVLYALDAATGEVVNAYGSISPLVPSDTRPISDGKGLLHLGRTEYTLEIHERTSAQAWRLKFAKWEPNLRDMDLQQQYQTPMDNMHIVPISNSTVMAVVEGDVRPQRWIRDISHVVKVFDVVSEDRNSFVVLPQPTLKLPQTLKEGALYVDVTADGDFYALGQDYQAVIVSAKNAPWCAGARTFRSKNELEDLLIGVHPPWCRGGPDDSSFNNSPQKQIGAAPEYPQLPPGTSPSWFSRIMEEVLRFAIIAIFFIIAARQDLFSQLANSIKKYAIMGPWGSKPVENEKEPDDQALVNQPQLQQQQPQPQQQQQKRKRGKRGGRKVRDTKRKDDVGEIMGPLTVSNDILGYGSHGTTVLKGRFQNREVAIKRMLVSFFETANREIRILQESDDHQNVVRYYCKHETDQFLYIALELCPGTIEDLLHPEKSPDQREELELLQSMLEPLDGLQQIVQGVDYLHSLKIVHRDIKPQNILVSNPKTIYKARAENDKTKVPTAGPVRLLISDFGLCKKLDSDQSSFHNTTAAGAGTSGWTAPEISMGSRYVGKSDTHEFSSDIIVEGNQSRRLTRAVDIFSLGCVFYYILSPGLHPFGEGYMRQPNIENQEFNLDGLKHLKYAKEATDLIESMIAFYPSDRPDTQEILLHPLFWSDRQKLDLLCKVSDRLEHDTREEYSELLQKLELHAPQVVGNDWHKEFPSWFVDNLGKYRKYRGDRIIDLLRALRNKLNHFNDFDDELKEKLGPIPSGYLDFFTSRFPNLFMVVYHYAKQNFRDEDVFVYYFKPKYHA